MCKGTNNLHLPPQQRPTDRGEGGRKSPPAGTRFPILHSSAETHLCMTWHLWLGGRARGPSLASIHPYSSIRSSHECSHTVLLAHTGRTPHTHLCLEPHPKEKRERKTEKRKNEGGGMTLWQPFLTSSVYAYKWTHLCAIVSWILFYFLRGLLRYPSLRGAQKYLWPCSGAL